MKRNLKGLGEAEAAAASMSASSIAAFRMSSINCVPQRFVPLEAKSGVAGGGMDAAFDVVVVSTSQWMGRTGAAAVAVAIVVVAAELTMVAGNAALS